jgi:hypothetical protein
MIFLGGRAVNRKWRKIHSYRLHILSCIGLTIRIMRGKRGLRVLRTEYLDLCRNKWQEYEERVWAVIYNNFFSPNMIIQKTWESQRKRGERGRYTRFSKGLIILRITRFLNFIHRLLFQKLKHVTFQKEDVFPSSGEWGDTCSVGSLRKN